MNQVKPLYIVELVYLFQFIIRAYNLFSLFFSTETTLKKVERSSLMLAYEVNAVGPILVMKVCSLVT